MNTLSHEQIAQKLKHLPALPTVLNAVLASFGDEEADIAMISRQIASDQSLTARLLRVANSSFYGLQCRVATINEAVVVLGFRAVRSMALTLSVSSAFKTGDCPGFDPHRYASHCAGTGLAAKALAQAIGRNADLAFTGGVLHDIGKLALASLFPINYAAAMAYRKLHDCPDVVAERDVLGLDHALVGGMLADAWNFPPILRSAMAEHHSPSAATADSLADLVHVADAVAHGLGLSGADLVMPVDQTAWQRLGLDQAIMAAVLPQVIDGLDEVSQLLKA